jgi:hypothetical protein
MPYSEVWDNFVSNMYKQGLLKQAKKEDGKKDTTKDLYNVHGHTGEQTIDEAHPGGGPTVAESETKDGGKVETQTEQQEKDIEVATKTPTGNIIAEIVGELIKAADKYEERGEIAVAKEIDNTIQEILSDASLKPIINVEMPSVIADCLEAPCNPVRPIYEERYTFNWNKTLSTDNIDGKEVHTVRYEYDDNGSRKNETKEFSSQEEAQEYYNSLCPSMFEDNKDGEEETNTDDLLADKSEKEPKEDDKKEEGPDQQEPKEEEKTE